MTGQRAWRSAAGVALVALGSVSGCTTSGDRPEPGLPYVKIGVLDPTSGANATTGLDARHGAELAAEIVNGEHSGISLPLARARGLPRLGNAKLRLVFADTKGDPDTGAREVERLVTDERVVALTGAYQSAVTKTASERAERLKVPFVNGDSSSTELTSRGLDYFFRTGPSDLTFGQPFFSLIKERQGAGERVSSIAILHTTDQYGSDGARVTTELATEFGLRVALDVGYDAQTTDLTPYVRQVRAADPDVLFVLSYITDSLLLQRAFDQLDYLPPAVMGYGAGFSDPRFIAGREHRANAEGLVRRTSWSPQIAARNPTAKRIAELFQQKFGDPMTENSARAFTAVMTLALAVNEAGTPDPDQIRSALQNTDIAGRDLIVPWDGVKFDDNHQNSGARGVIEQYLGGEWQVVYPRDVASREIVWPAADAPGRG